MLLGRPNHRGSFSVCALSQYQKLAIKIILQGKYPSLQPALHTLWEQISGACWEHAGALRGQCRAEFDYLMKCLRKYFQFDTPPFDYGAAPRKERRRRLNATYWCVICLPTAAGEPQNLSMATFQCSYCLLQSILYITVAVSDARVLSFIC